MLYLLTVALWATWRIFVAISATALILAMFLMPVALFWLGAVVGHIDTITP